MKNAKLLLDDISNWYVRRNRRRFWKSENDNDKMAAYTTLYNVLLTYIKVLSPIIPFISEDIYNNLVCSFDDDAPSSIHLNGYPKINDKNIDENLIFEVDMVKQIVSFGRSARNKANLKIRQPLESVNIFINDKNFKLIKIYEVQILEELNVKAINYISDANKIVKYEIKPNFDTLGKSIQHRP